MGSAFSSAARRTAALNAASSDLSNYTILVTGSSVGIGLETCRVLATRGARVVMVARDRSKNEAAIARLRKDLGSDLRGSFEPMEADLSSLASVRQMVEAFKAKNWNLNVLICNAGVFNTPYGFTTDGIDMQMGTNHVAHHYLTKLLMPKMIATAREFGVPSRVVVVSSSLHQGQKSINYDRLPFTTKDAYSGFQAYGQSKYANMLFANELNQRYSSQGVYGFSLHPGVIGTGVFKHTTGATLIRVLGRPFFKSVQQGAATTVYCTVEPSLTQAGFAGEYYVDSQVDRSAMLAVKTGEGQRLWEWTEKIIQEKTAAM